MNQKAKGVWVRRNGQIFLRINGVDIPGLFCAEIVTAVHHALKMPFSVEGFLDSVARCLASTEEEAPAKSAGAVEGE